jgi:hypothetical protein
VHTHRRDLGPAPALAGVGQLVVQRFAGFAVFGALWTACFGFRDCCLALSVPSRRRENYPPLTGLLRGAGISARPLIPLTQRVACVSSWSFFLCEIKCRSELEHGCSLH